MAASTPDRSIVVPVEAPARDQWRAAFADLAATWNDRRIWLLAAVIAVGNQYRRTILGPWWLTLTTVMFVFGLSILRLGISGGDLRDAVPYVGIGFIVFFLISGGVTSAAERLRRRRRPAVDLPPAVLDVRVREASRLR